MLKANPTGGVEQGCSKSETYGVFTRDEASGKRGLRLDLYLIGLTPARITPGNLRDFQHLRVPSLRFEVRPDLRYSLIGSNIWNRWKLDIPDYTSTWEKITTPNDIFFIRYRIAGLRAALWSPCFAWKRKVPQIFIGLNDRMNPDICCLGRDFLKMGILCWRGNQSFFFPMYQTPEIWRNSTFDNFSLPEVSDI